MIRRFAILNSDEISKGRIRFTLSALNSALLQCWNGIPSYLNHDRSRPFAVTRGSAIFIEPGLARLTGEVFIPQDQSEVKALEASLELYSRKKTSEMIAPWKDRFSRLLNLKSEMDVEFRYAGSVVANKQGIAVERFPEIFKSPDKDGLVEYPSLRLLAPGVFEKDGLLLFAHQYFRRGLSHSNTLNTPFLSRLHTMRLNPELRIKLAFDPNIVGYAESFQEEIELAYWWGPVFSNELESIPRGTTRYRLDDWERELCGFSGGEFQWYEQKHERVFESEELRDIPTVAVAADQFACRYVHSIFDSAIDRLRHMDGAVRVYTEEEMIARLDQTLTRASRQTEYTKLWRIDGPIPVADWKNLLNDYYRDNRSIGEYLGGEDSRSPRKDVTLTTPSTAQNTARVPVGFPHRGGGLRIAISYQSENIIRTGDVTVVPLVMKTKANTQSYLEFDSIELIKRLRTSGMAVFIEPDTVFFAFEDSNINFPPIFFSGERAYEHVTRALLEMRQLCDVWKSGKEERAVTFTIGLRFDGLVAVFSFAGHVHDVHEWLSDSRLALPESLNQVGRWAQSMRDSVESVSNNARPVIPIRSLLTEDGILSFRRKLIASNEFELVNESNSTDVKIRYLASGATGTPSPIVLIEQAQCSKCQADYASCSCSVVLEKEITVVVQQFRIAGAFWENELDTQ